MSNAILATPPTSSCETERLPAPRALREALPIPPAARRHVDETRRAIRDVLHGRDPHRLVVVVGPCSIHDPQQALEYARRLRVLADETRDALVLVMRTYFEKPRSRVGWKGFVNDPHLDDSRDVRSGIEGARRILVAIGEHGVACGAEVLDPLLAVYLEDALSWTAIGARTAESQPHRELASRLPMPVGFKNAMSGDVAVALDGVAAAQHPHHFLGIDDSGAAAVLSSPGNPDAHVVLRGGGGVPNHDAECVAWTAARAGRLGLVRPVWVDCSHGNSAKDHRRQGQVCREVLRQLEDGQRAIGGLMLESQLEAGNQRWAPGQPLAKGVSITDACIGWDETESLLRDAAEAVRLAGGSTPEN